MNLLQLMDLVASGEDGARQFKSDIRNAESLASEMAVFPMLMVASFSLALLTMVP